MTYARCCILIANFTNKITTTSNDWPQKSDRNPLQLRQLCLAVTGLALLGLYIRFLYLKHLFYKTSVPVMIRGCAQVELGGDQLSDNKSNCDQRATGIILTLNNFLLSLKQF